jgi:glutamyl-tRNA synthetase
MLVRTRFAPSPTGYLHIGGVRTAFFNWLFARHHGGQFILRLDDTDADRNDPAAVQPILDGFHWLGIDWDEGFDKGGPYGPYRQSERLDRYQAAVRVLLDKGLAYWDYATPDEVRQEREVAECEKRPFLYSRRWMAETESDRRRFEAEGRVGLVRLKMPREGVCVVEDHVRGRTEDQPRGRVAFEWAQEQDHVIQRADGSCLYNLANVVDDYDMRITHVIRAEEHFSNTPRQIFIVQGLGYPLPEYAHVPYVAAPGGKVKLSKRKIKEYMKTPEFRDIYRHGECIANRLGLAISDETFNPVMVEFYKVVGFLPEAVLNYIVLLGWSLDGTSEDFTVEALIGHFEDLMRVNQSPAGFDIKKLWAFQERYMQKVPLATKVERGLDYLQRAGIVPTPTPADVRAKVEAVVQAAGDRIKVFGDIFDYSTFFVADDALEFDEADFEKRIRKPAEAGPLLRKFQEQLATAEEFDAASLEKLANDFVQAEGIKLGQLVNAVRVAITGKAVGFGLYEALAILGKEHSLVRITRALQKLGAT